MPCPFKEVTMIPEDQTQFEDQQSIKPFLMESETILWTGRPPRGLIFRKSDPLYLLFTLVFCGGGLVSLFITHNRDQLGSALGFIILLGVLGLYLSFGRFIYDMLVRRKTVYGLTNHRILILSGLFRQRFEEFSLKDPPPISLRLSTNGRGTIIFSTASSVDFFMVNPNIPGVTTPSMFERIPDANRVYQLIQSMAKQSGSY